MNANRGAESGQPALDERRQLARAAGTLGALTLVSRVSGLLRDMVIGALFGASPAADAFFVAFRIPNLFRRVVAEGASSTAFVPVFTSYLQRGGRGAAIAAAGAVGGLAAVVLVALAAAGCLFAEQVVALFAPGFAADPAKSALTVRLTALLFPYLALVGMAAWAMGTLHTFRSFAVPAYGPILLNLAIIVAAVGLTPVISPPVFALVVGVLLGGMLQFAIQVPALGRLGLRPAGLVAVRHPAVGRVGALLLPTLLGGAVYQVNILVATMFASMLPDRSVSYLWYADRLFEFPLGIVAVAVGTAALPSLAGHASQARYAEMGQGTAHALQLVWSLCIPAMVGLWMLAPCLVAVLFERGEFGAVDTLMTARALRAYSVGLFGVASIRVLVSVFYALERPRIPVLTAMVALVINAVCDLALMGPVESDAPGAAAAAIAGLASALSVADLDHVGLALGTAVAASANACLLFVFARRAVGSLGGTQLWVSARRHILASVAMAGAIAVWSRVVTFDAPWQDYAELTGGIVIGGCVYTATALALGSDELRDMLRLLRGRRG